MSKYYRFMNHFGINKRFHKVTPVPLQTKPNELCSPVEARLDAVEQFKPDMSCRIKNKPVQLHDKLGNHTTLFKNGTVCSLYLAPTNKHFRILPQESTVIDIIRQNGTAKRFKTIIGAEKIIANIPKLKHRNLFQSALRRNCTDTTIVQTAQGHIALIAIGSLGVNYIHNSLQIGKTYSQGALAGYFALGSSMLVITSEAYTITHAGGKIILGEKLGHSTSQ